MIRMPACLCRQKRKNKRPNGAAKVDGPEVPIETGKEDLDLEKDETEEIIIKG